MTNVERRAGDRNQEKLGTWRQFARLVLIAQFYLAVVLSLASVFFGWELAVASIAVGLSALFCVLVHAATDFRSLVVWFALLVRHQTGERTREDTDRAWQELMGRLPHEWLN